METLIESTQLAKIHNALVNRRHGVIAHIVEDPEHPETRGLFVINTYMNEPSYFRQNGQSPVRAPRAAAGAAFDRVSALWGALGESIERYSASIYDSSNFKYASLNELGAAADDLRQAILFGEAEYQQTDFEFAALDPDLQRAWVRAHDLRDANREVYVPAQMVYLAMNVRDRREIIAQSVSTGLACGSDEERTLLGALNEVIERDGFAGMWYMRYAPRQVNITDATLARLLPGVQRALKRSMLDLRVYDLTSDIGVPTMTCVARSAGDSAVAVGASTHLDVHSAINKAVIEALHGFNWARMFYDEGRALPKLEDLKDPSDHFCYYLDPANQWGLDFMAQNATSISSEDPSLYQHKNLSDLIARLDQLGYAPLIAEATTSDADSVGLRVFRALIPGLQPLYFGSRVNSSDHRRLETLARFWGLSEVPELNPAPHPFP